MALWFVNRVFVHNVEETGLSTMTRQE
jgi:hypothetical protein